MVKVQRLFAKTNLKFQFAALVPSRVWGRRGARDGKAVCAFLREGRGEGLPGYGARAAGRGCLGTAPVNSVYIFDDRVVLNINFMDDAKTVTREEVLGSSAVDNVPACWDRTR